MKNPNFVIKFMIFNLILSIIKGNYTFYNLSTKMPNITGVRQSSAINSVYKGINYSGIYNFTISDEKHFTEVTIRVQYKKVIRDKYMINVNLTSWHNLTCPKYYSTNFTSQQIEKNDVSENDLHKTMMKFIDIARPISTVNYSNLTGYISHINSKSTIVIRERYPRIMCLNLIKNRQFNYSLDEVELKTYEIYYEEKNGLVLKNSKKTHLC